MKNFSQADPSVQLGPTLQLINGKWVPSSDGQTLAIESPSTKKVIAHVPRSSLDDVNCAVSAAALAFDNWKRVSATDRGRLLFRIGEAIEGKIELLARITAHESGNAIRTQARPEAKHVADIFRYFGGLAHELKGMTLPLGDGVLSYTRREPLGVVAAITPWNSPLAIAAMKIAPAICAGNTVVIKLSEEAPLGGLLLAEICSEYLPAGVLNVIVGIGSESGSALAAHPRVNKLSFTGSTSVGRSVMASASTYIVPVSLELGGKSPSIVFEDANEDWAVEGVASAMRFTRQSQSCTAGSRLYVHESIYDSFLDKLASRIRKYSIGDPLVEETDMGSLISAKQFRTVCSYIEEGITQKELRLIAGGMPPISGPLSEGYFTIPTIFGSRSNDWRIAREEIFGPVLVAIPWRNEEEVVRMANDSHYGLAGYVFSLDTARAIRTAHSLNAGWIQINQGKGQQLGQPYGGFKQSGIGKENSLGSILDGFSQEKTVTVNLDLHV